jgi:hypothetical protein
MAFYADLLRQLPCHRIRLSDNPQEIAGRLRAFITELRP